MRNFQWALGLLALILIGAGCTPPQPPTSEQMSENAEAILFQEDTTFEVNSTVFGIGGIFAKNILSGGTQKDVMIHEYVPGESVEFSWGMEIEQETPESINARAVFEATEEDFVGSDAPRPEYEAVIVSGTIISNSLDDSESLLLPVYWEEGDTVANNRSVIWLGKKQYDDLVKDGETRTRLGIFDGLNKILSFSDGVRNKLNELRGETDAKQLRDLYKLEAERDFGRYSVKVDGKRQWVQTIEAKSIFGHFTILANPDNPLVLKLTLNSAALSSLAPLTSLKTIDALIGYEIKNINL